MATFPTTPNFQLPFVLRAKFANVTVVQDPGQQYGYYHEATPLHRWELEYPILTDAEVTILREFYEARGGAWETFAFTDPDTDADYTCRFDGDFDHTYTGPGINKVRVAILETR